MGLLTKTLLTVLLASPTAGCNCRENYLEKGVVAVANSTETEMKDKYLSRVAQSDSKLFPLMRGGKGKLTEYLSERLSQLNHLNPKDYHQLVEAELMNTPSSEELAQFNIESLIRVYYLLEILSDSTFRKDIGQELERDTNDSTREYGGVFHLLSERSVQVEMLPNTMDCIGSEIIIGSHSPDSSYCPGSPQFTLDILAVFHFHAQKINHQESAALSHNDFWGGGAVFTRVGEKRFNVDFAMYYQKVGKGHLVNLDLGIYEY